MTKDGKIPERTEGQRRFDDLFSQAVENRKTSCFWDDGDWEDRWELQDAYALPTIEEGASDKYESSVRSPEILGRIQSTMHKLSKMNLSFVIRPKNSAAKMAARVDELVVNYFFTQQGYRDTIRDVFYTAITKGSSPIGVEWLKRTRKVKQLMTDPERMSPEEKKQVKKGEMVYVEVEQVDVNAPILIGYPLQSVYLDPAARNMQGEVHNCGYAFVAELITFESFKNQYLNKEGFKNTELVKPISSDSTSEEGEVAAPDRYMYPPISDDGEYVYLVRGWDYYKDEYKVRANSVYIKESPLPYSDKKIPFTILKPYSLPNQIYGVGMVDLLIPSVYQLELIQNAFYDYILYTTNPVLLVQNNDYGDFSRKYKLVNGEPGSLLPVSDPQSSVLPLKFPMVNSDVYQGIGLLQKDAVLASQHDPNQLGVLKKDATATANIINKEIAEAYVNYIADNFSSGLQDIARMVVSRIHEFMTRPQVSKLVNGETIEGEPFEVAIPGKYVDVDWDERTVKIEENPERVSVLKIKKDLYRYEDENGKIVEITPNDFEVMLSSESKEILSRALEQQRIMDAMKMLMPYAVNPVDGERAAMNPLPLFNAVEIADQFVNTMGLSPKILLNRSEDEKSDIERAKTQNEEMFSGNRSMPKAGESATHVREHTEFMHMLTNRFSDMKIEIESMIRAGMQVTPEIQQQFDQIRVTLPLLSEHIDFDTTNIVNEPRMMSQAGMIQSMPPQGPNTGVGQQVTQSGMGGDSALPNVPKQSGYTQGGAGPLTKM